VTLAAPGGTRHAVAGGPQRQRQRGAAVGVAVGGVRGAILAKDEC